MAGRRGKRYREAIGEVDRTHAYSPTEAIALIKQAAGLEKGSGEPNREKVGRISKAQVREIAERKMPDLNAHDVDQASKIIEGTARSMGVEVG